MGNNTLKNSDADELLRQIAYARRHYDGVKLDEEMRRIRALAGKLAHDNFKEIQACQNNPTPDCINKIKAEYKDVNFAGLQDAYRKYQGTHTILNGYAYRNNSVISCADSGFADCIVRKDGERVMQEGAYAAIGGVRAGRNQVTAPINKPSANVGNQASKGSKDINKTGQTTKPTTMKNKVTCSSVNVCFTAGTLIHTTDGLKPIETITHGDLIWSRQEFGDEYDYRPVIATKVTPNQEVYEVVVKHSNNATETFKTTSEHPFWVNGIGWLKASLLEQGMTLLDQHGNPNITIISQTKLDHTETVYNFEVQDFHTYHIGEYGVWVHNADCCGVGIVYDNIRPTQDFVAGTSIPKSFELTTSSGIFWVHPNATKHMVENITRKGMDPQTQNIRSQTILTSFHSAVNKATTRGIEYDKMMYIDGWELIFTKGRDGDRLPVIKHTLYK